MFLSLAFVCACFLSRSTIIEREVGFARNLEIRDRVLLESWTLHYLTERELILSLSSLIPWKDSGTPITRTWARELANNLRAS